MRLDPISTIDLMTLLLELSSHTKMGIILCDSFTTNLEEEEFKILYDDEVHLKLGYKPLVWDKADSFEQIGV